MARRYVGDEEGFAMIRINLDVSVEVLLILDEDQVRALDAIVGYGPKAFVKGFKEKLGKAYIAPYEKGVYSLFEAVIKQIRPALHKIDDARKALSRSEVKSDMKYEVNHAGRRRKDSL